MKKKLYILLLLTLCCGSAIAQDTFYSVFSYAYEIPKVTINDRAYDLQKSLFPKMYKNRSLTADMRWVQQHDSALTDFWAVQGDTILHILTELSGIEWEETEFDMYFLRYYAQIGASDPLILPLGGIHNGAFIESAPDLQKQKLLLIYFLAKRMLLQSDRPGDAEKISISFHPLMRKTPYRFDNLAMLLAVTTSYSIMGVDTTYDITQSKFWKNKFPGRKIFTDYFERDWILTPEKTLSEWIANEPTGSRLVSVTRAPRIVQKDQFVELKAYVEDLPLKGIFGFAVSLNDAGHPMVTEIDMYRLAYACGLRSDDVIRRIDGKIVRNHKQMIEYLLEKYNEGGSILEIKRMGQSMEIIIQPLEVDYYEDEYYLDEYNQDDTAYFDTIPPELELILVTPILYNISMDEFEHTRKTYNQIAASYHKKRTNQNDSTWNDHLEIPAMSSILEPIVFGKKVLDLGCGTGLFTKEIQSWGGDVCGIDISEEMIQIAQLQNPNLKFKIGNSQEIPYANETFDIVSSSLVMHYVQDLVPSFTEIKRVLTKNGQFIFSMHHPMNETLDLVKNDSDTYPVMQPYFHNNKYYWKMCGEELLSFHHTFENIVQSLKTAGFVLKDMIECRPIPDLKDSFDSYEFTSQYPTFCVFHAIRF